MKQREDYWRTAWLALLAAAGVMAAFAVLGSPDFGQRVTLVAVSAVLAAGGLMIWGLHPRHPSS